MRRTPLKRYTRLKPRGNTKHARRKRDWEYMAWVRGQSCIVRQLIPNASVCVGRPEAHHIGGRYGENTDRNCVPMCPFHHRQWHGVVGGGGIFAGWSVARRRGWGAIAVAVTQAAYGGAL
jgi:hypothetical protein